MADAPDVLVLGGGGVVGEAWMLGVLAGLEQASGIDTRRSGAFVGTSAGSIVAATLASGRGPASRLGEPPAAPAARPDAGVDDGDGVAGMASRALGTALRAGVAAAGTVAPLALRSTERGGALVRRVALGRVPAGRHSLAGLGRRVDDSGVTFDGRLLIAAVELGSGRRTVFGAAGAPSASVGQAVEASCAIPGWFRPVVIDGTSFVDGGAWSPTNMDVAPVERGARVLCLNPTGSLRPSFGRPLAAVGPLSRGVAAVEARALERRGAHVHNVSPDHTSATAMGTNFMDPRVREAATHGGYAQGYALAARL
jgi:NTE family protein